MKRYAGYEQDDGWISCERGETEEAEIEAVDDEGERVLSY